MKELIKYSFLILISINLFSACTANRDKNPPAQLTPEQKANLGLFEAIFANEANAVKDNLEKGADPNARDDEGYPAIIRAVQVGSPIIVEMLILKGARIFELRAWDEELTTAFSYLSEDTHPLVAKEIRDEAQRLGTQAERLIGQRDFKGAKSFFIENKLPAGLLMPENEISALRWLSIKMQPGDNTDLISSLITNPRTKKETLEDARKEMNQLASRLKDSAFFKKALESYKNLNAVHEFTKILDKDADLLWLTTKLNTLRSFNETPRTVDVTNLVFSNKIRFENVSEDTFRALLEEVLETSSTHQEKSYFVGKAVEEFLKRAGGDAKYYFWVTHIIEAWSVKNIEASNGSFDSYARLAFSAFKPGEFSFKNLESLLVSIKTFAPTWGPEDEDAFSYLLGDRFLGENRIKLLKTLYGVTKAAPKRIFSLSIENGGIAALTDFVATGIPYNKENQKEAVLVAVSSSSSPGESLDMLRTLKSEDVDFISSFGIEALKRSFEKSWAGEGYEGVVGFLLNQSPSIFTAMNKEEKRDLLIGILENIRKRNQDWRALSDVIKQAGFSSSEIYKRELGIDEIDPVSVQISMIWDIVITGYEVVRASPDELDEVIAFIKGSVDLLPKETASMAIVLKNSSGLDQSKNLTHSILPLSILFSLGEEKIASALTRDENSSVEIKQKFHSGLGDFSWKGFVESKLFSYFTENKKYWTNIISSIDSPIVLPDGIDSATFTTVVSGSDMLRDNPAIAHKFEGIKINLSSEEKSCEFREFSSGPAFKNFQQGGGLVTLKTKDWTNLGAFEALISLKDKTCKGVGLSEGEVSFTKAIIENNFSPSSVITRFGVGGLDKGVDRVCGQNAGEYNPSLKQGRFSLMGVLSPNTEEEMGTVPVVSPEAISFDNECKYFEYDQKVHETAKKQFLDSWYKCAVDQEAESIGAMFESFKDKYSLAPRLPGKAINLCTL